MPCYLCEAQAGLCKKCCNDQISLIRETCTLLDNLNNMSRLSINQIFNQVQSLQQNQYNQGTHSQLDIASNIHNTQVFEEIPKINDTAIVLLAQQLLRLDIVNQKLKNYQILKTQESLKKRMQRTQNHIDTLKLRIKSERDKIDDTEKVLNKVRQRLMHKTVEDEAFEVTKSERVCKVITRFQLNAFKVLIDVFFSTHGSYISKKLYFCKQPIINIEKFMSYNSRLELLNQFLENLIIFQVRLTQLFSDTDMKLPYLSELQRLLPDSKFYEVVRRKEVEMFGDSDKEQISVKDTELEQDAPPPSKQTTDGLVIHLGEALKLPLSSKTLNNQRRMRSVSVELSEQQSHTSSVDGHLKKENNKTISDQRNPIGGLSGKKMVIVPHKILTKPFSKLSPKEYMRFLQIVVKILVNFKVFFSYTQPLTEEFDIYKILNHVYGLVSFFEQKLDKAHTISLLASKKEQAESVESLIVADNITPKPSIKNFYSRFFNYDSQNTSNNRRGNSGSAGRAIFGNVSEIDQSVQIKVSPQNENEFKASMRKVYTLMINDNMHKNIMENWDNISKTM